MAGLITGPAQAAGAERGVHSADVEGGPVSAWCLGPGDAGMPVLTSSSWCHVGDTRGSGVSRKVGAGGEDRVVDPTTCGSVHWPERGSGTVVGEPQSPL